MKNSDKDYKIKPIEIQRRGDVSGYLMVHEVAELLDFREKLHIVPGVIRATINQCSKCVHCCRKTSGEVWKLIAKPAGVYVAVAGGGSYSSIAHDRRYSTFCTEGTNIDPNQDFFDVSSSGDLRIIPAEGIKDSKTPFKCPFGKFQKS